MRMYVLTTIKWLQYLITAFKRHVDCRLAPQHPQNETKNITHPVTNKIMGAEIILSSKKIL